MKKTVVALILLCTFSACGPSAADRANLNNALIELRSQLAGEEAKLQSVQSIHLFRSKERKAKEVAEQTRIIEELRLRISDIEKRLGN